MGRLDWARRSRGRYAATVSRPQVELEFYPPKSRLPGPARDRGLNQPAVGLRRLPSSSWARGRGGPQSAQSPVVADRRNGPGRLVL